MIPEPPRQALILPSFEQLPERRHCRFSTVKSGDSVADAANGSHIGIRGEGLNSSRIEKRLAASIAGADERWLKLPAPERARPARRCAMVVSKAPST